jgi:multiple sugar transport system substrate-binding protein
MKKKTFVLAVLCVPVLFGLVFTGCKRKEAAESAGAGSGGSIRFSWWGNAVRDERTIKAVQLFMEKNPGVTVETEPTEWSSYWSKLNTQVAAGSLPDVMQQDYSYIIQYNDRNQLVDMNAYAQKGVIDLSKWSDSGLSSGRLDGKLIALSLGTNAWGICVDPAVLQKAGITIDDTKWTWKDFEQAALTIYQKTGIQTRPIDQISQIYEHAIRQFGLALYTKDGKSIGWANNTGIIKELLDMDLRLKAAGALYDPEDTFIVGRAFEEETICRGKTWNSYYWSNQHTGFVKAANRPLDYYISPTFNGNKAPFGTYLKPAMFISMLSASKNQDLSAKFVNFFANDLEANRILLAERGIPVPSDVRTDLSPRVDPGMKYLFDYITKVTPFTTPIDPPYPAAHNEAIDVMRSITLQCLTGKISSEDAVAQMVQMSNEIVSR